VTWLAAAAALPLVGLVLLKGFSLWSPDAVERIDAHSWSLRAERSPIPT